MTTEESGSFDRLEVNISPAIAEFIRGWMIFHNTSATELTRRAFAFYEVLHNAFIDGKVVQIIDPTSGSRQVITEQDFQARS